MMQSDQTFADYRKSSKKALALTPHTSMGQYLMTYEGLVLYVKEMDEDRYQRLCSVSLLSTRLARYRLADLSV